MEQRCRDGEPGAWTVLGPAGSGRSSVLVDRWQRSALRHGSGRVLFLAATGRAVHQVRGRLEAAGASLDELASVRIPARLSGARVASPWQRSAAVESLLRREGRSQWPTLFPLLRRAAFAAEVTTALALVARSGAHPDAILARAGLAGEGDRWRELLAFGDRVDEALALRGLTQPFRSLSVPREGRPAAVLVDDADAVAPAVADTLIAWEAAGVEVTAAGDPDRSATPHPWWAARLGGGVGPVLRLSPTPAPPARRLVMSRHPSLEASATAAALLDARARGARWEQMAVVVADAEQRARVHGALARHRIPADGSAANPAGEPVVHAVLDAVRAARGDDQARARLAGSPLAEGGPPLADELCEQLRAVLGDDPGATDPARIADIAWQFGLARLVGDPRSARPWDDHALDVAVALVEGMRRRASADRSWRWRDEEALLASSGGAYAGALPGAGVMAGRPAGADRVAVGSPEELLGTRFSTVVVSGCVEGALPRAVSPRSFFDRELLVDEPPGDGGVRQARRLAAERDRFAGVTAMAREDLIAVAGPGPAGLVSRFVADWERVELPLPERVASPVRPVTTRTVGAVPVHPERRLQLSASQVATYTDCPQRYAFQYPLAARVAPGVWADMGTYVHAVLAEFALGPDHSWERLESVAAAKWSDQLAPFAPQREEIRRETAGMFRTWWDREWSEPPGPDILAVEYPFSLTVGPHSVVGRIDRVDRVPGGLAVIDYKTGSRLPAAADVADDIQLALYHLAATCDETLSSAGPPARLQLRYLRHGVDVDQPILDDHRARTEATILEVAARILDEDFTPSPTADCDTCPFRRLCPLQDEGQPVGAR